MAAHSVTAEDLVQETFLRAWRLCQDPSGETLWLEIDGAAVSVMTSFVTPALFPVFGLGVVIPND